MPGPRQTLEVLEGKGCKHLTKKEKGERAAAEVRVDSSKPVRPPGWLPDDLKKEFRALDRELRAVVPFCKLDAPALGRYLVAQDAWLKATDRASDALSREDAEDAQAWSAIQDRYFKQCRNIAADMGLTVTSRCRLVLPPGTGGRKPEENPFEAMMRQRQERMGRA